MQKIYHRATETRRKITEKNLYNMNMKKIDPNFGLSTLVTHVTEGEDPRFSHVTPIYQSSVFDFPDVETGARIFSGDVPGLNYTRWNNPNQQQLAEKIAFIEGIDLLRAQPDRTARAGGGRDGFQLGHGSDFGGDPFAGAQGPGGDRAEVAVYRRARAARQAGPQLGDRTRLPRRSDPRALAGGLPGASQCGAGVLRITGEPHHEHGRPEGSRRHRPPAGAWLAVDNTFATPYCQRPLSLGADVVMHSTTKYLSGHGLIIGGAVASRHPDYIHKELFGMMKMLGGTESPFDAWLVNLGLKTFELRMQRHCENAMRVAQFLEAHPAVEAVHYPGLESHPQHELACRQMLHFGGMMSFELRGGLEAGARMMNRVKVATLAVSLGLVDTVVSHPASMTHSGLSPQARKAAGIREGLVRLSVGIENVEDLIADFDQAMR